MQDAETWLALANANDTIDERPSKISPDKSAPPPPVFRPLFYPAWEVLPHEAKLPHADVISERLETLVALSNPNDSKTKTSASKATAIESSPFIVTNVVALLQKTFNPRTLNERTRALARGDRIEPRALVEWLEAQGYEPEAQVTQKGELALRGGILDVFPLTSPWPIRLEFFGDELESIRQFDPTTQISRAEISSATIPPAGEIGRAHV